MAEGLDHNTVTESEQSADFKCTVTCANNFFQAQYTHTDVLNVVFPGLVTLNKLKISTNDTKALVS